MRIIKAFRFICVTALLMIGASANAYDITVDGMYYNVMSLSDLTCSVTFGDKKYTGDIIIPDKVTYNNKTLTVTTIGESAFSGCSSLTSITIPNSVTEIGKQAFYNCQSLTSVTIGNSVTKIGVGAFYGCSSLTNITIPNSVTEIGGLAFYNCQSLTSVTIGNSVTKIGVNAFNGCSSLTNITIPNSVTEIGERAFYACSELKKVIIEDGTETLSFIDFGETFCNCPLTWLYLGRNISYFDSPFRNFYMLTEVTIGNSVTRILYKEFENCSSLTNITIPNSVTEIGERAFYNCQSLTSVTIGNSMTKIDDYAFYNCFGLTVLYSLNPTPPTVGTGNFTTVQYMNLNVYVPQGSLSAYQAVDTWKNFWNLQEIDPTGVETIKADGKKADDAIYDIQGRKLDAPKKGLNIINGKKVLIKK